MEYTSFGSPKIFTRKTLVFISLFIIMLIIIPLLLKSQETLQVTPQLNFGITPTPTSPPFELKNANQIINKENSDLQEAIEQINIDLKTSLKLIPLSG